MKVQLPLLIYFFLFTATSSQVVFATDLGPQELLRTLNDIKTKYARQPGMILTQLTLLRDQTSYFKTHPTDSITANYIDTYRTAYEINRMSEKVECLRR